MSSQIRLSDDDVAFLLSLLRIQGRFMSADAPVRVTLSSLVDFLGRDGGSVKPEAVRKAIEANPAVFAVVEVEDDLIVSTTQAGTVPGERRPSAHTLAQRFMTPPPKPERPAQPVRERPRVDPSWASLPTVLD